MMNSEDIKTALVMMYSIDQEDFWYIPTGNTVRIRFNVASISTSFRLEINFDPNMKAKIYEGLHINPILAGDRIDRSILGLYLKEAEISMRPEILDLTFEVEDASNAIITDW